MSATDNFQLLVKAARALAELREEVVFLGGCTTALLITDPAAPDVRSTNDVDVIVDTASRSDYYALCDRLRALGFREDTSDKAPLCRWNHPEQITLDVMPTDPSILGFSNRWYPDAITHAERRALQTGLVIHVVTPPYFCATKIEAFQGRGKGDYAASHDLEDLVAVIDGRPQIISEIQSAPADIRHFIASEIGAFLRTREFQDVVGGFLPFDAASQARLPRLLDQLAAIAALTPPAPPAA